MTDDTDPSPTCQALRTALGTRLSAEALDWLDRGIERVSASAEPLAPLAPIFAAASRRLAGISLGSALAWVGDPLAALTTPCGPVDANRWTCTDGGRTLLLEAAIRRAGDAWDRLIRDLFRDGDEGERVSLVRALCLTPEPSRLLQTALEAGRATSLRLYGALALDNPYPACCYPDHDFNGLVLKCLFTGLPVGRISGLAQRTNATLARMCEDYHDERVLANRAVPADIWLALVPYASRRGLDLALGALGADDPTHRYHAALALGARRAEPVIGAALAARRSVEPDPRIAAVLTPEGKAA